MYISGGSLAWFRLGKESMQIFTFGRYNANINLSTFIAERCLSFVLKYFFCNKWIHFCDHKYNT